MAPERDIDLVSGCDDGRVYLHVNDGKQQFSSRSSLRSGGANWGLALHDFNADGQLDIAAASYIDKKLCIHLNDGTGGFLREQVVLSGDHNFDLAVGDVDLDGDPDLISCSTLDRAVHFHLNDGKGFFGPGLAMKSGNWNAGVEVLDLDQDGDLDIATASINDHMIHVHQALAAREVTFRKAKYQLEVTVISGDTDKPLKAVNVNLLRKNGSTEAAGMTDESGKIVFFPPENRNYTLVVRTEDLPVYRESFDMPAENLHKQVVLAAPKGSFVYGKVRDEETNRILAGAHVSIYDDIGNLVVETQADEKANYRAELEFGKNYEILGETAGYMARTYTFDLPENLYREKGLRQDLLLRAPKGRCVSGYVRDAITLEVVTNAKMIVRTQAGNTVRKIKVRPNGRYRLCLDFDQYQFNTSATGYFFNLSEIELDKDNLTEDLNHDILLDPLAEGASIVLENIYFDVDKATLRIESMEELDRLVKIMEENPALVVEIGGHTDSDASNDYNTRLSQNRAQSVVDYLGEAGIPSTRMLAQGYGEEQPIVPNDSQANKQLNRRTEFKIISNDRQ
ncbi:MAG: OmpA family protein [Bacteroidota bacterium]